MLILTTSRAHSTSWPITPEFTQSTEGLHLLQKDLKSIQMKILFHSLLIKAISKPSLTLERKISEKLKSIFLLIKSLSLFVTKDEQTLYSFQRLVKAFKKGVHSVTKSFKAQSTLKTVFCYDLKTNNRLNV